MLKKKNIAMVMAAATVATSVAPVFALESQSVTKEELVKEVKEKLAVKYSGKDAESVYDIIVKRGTQAEETIKTMTELEKILEMAEVKGEEVTVDIVDKGHVENSDGKIVNVVDGKSYETALAEATNGKAAAQKALEAAQTAVTEKEKALDEATKAQVAAQTALEEADEDGKAAAEKALEAAQTAVTEKEKALDEATKAQAAAETALDEFKNIVEGETVIDFIAREMSAGNKAIDKVIALDANEKEYEITKNEDGNLEYTDSDNKTIASDASEKIDNIKVILKSGVELIVNGETAQLDITKGLDKDGNDVYIDRADEETAKRVVDFKFVEVKEDAKAVDIPSRVVANMTTKVNSLTKEEFNLSTFKTEKGYTEAGKELVGLLKLASDEDKNVTTTKDGKVYQVRFHQDSKDNLKVVAVKDGGYALNIDLRVSESGKKLPSNENVRLVVKSNVQADLADFKDIIQKGEIVTTANYKTLKGDTRFETAIKISKEAYKQDGTAEGVVLVGENAVVDGLASAPLAAQKKAPILLTKKDAIPEETMKEIKRLVAKGAPIYLIGGENTISKSVEVQLAKEMNADIKRLSGDDRYDTSLKIAKELKSTSKEAFVVGGDGLADAMSVASVAAQKRTPIIVSPAEGLTRDAKAFLDDETNKIATVDVVGGKTKVSTQVLKDIVEIKNGDAQKALVADRISGTDRNDTNAKVIKEYFEKSSDLENVYVAKDGDAQLVDALAAAPLAGNGTNKGVIVLATNDLTKAQVEELKLKKNDQKVTQIGGGIASVVIQKVLKAVVK
ncbi:cell wall-binding repeat-containing protein [Asaccharospora irregularis]|uniref:Putative cell wall binding repeat 2 n=1 Tax=Asaccharospora irregularis DSM 2635 TaxID=1121321 RepID=A0A1M5PTL5_9FIRM|nr:cell wall-binding repeat-containing protein [Asaccharospora irregularis]SHH04896.1 Putative cell wall binding repeat 2 [Asaccharospora irregularis DSM 2635]